jgi:hypothetical protein
MSEWVFVPRHPTPSQDRELIGAMDSPNTRGHEYFMDCFVVLQGPFRGPWEVF